MDLQITNGETSYKWKKFKNGIGFIAIVTLDVIPGPIGKNEIIEHYSGRGFTSQGYIEEVPENGYYSWKLAARKGLEYAFSLVDTHWTVHIHKIEGASTDTNPTIVGYTVARAFLEKINAHLNDKQIEEIEEFVLSSWAKPYKELIPDFFNLTFTEYTD